MIPSITTGIRVYISLRRRKEAVRDRARTIGQSFGSALNRDWRE